MTPRSPTTCRVCGLSSAIARSGGRCRACVGLECAQCHATSGGHRVGCPAKVRWCQSGCGRAAHGRFNLCQPCYEERAAQLARQAVTPDVIADVYATARGAAQRRAAQIGDPTESEDALQDAVLALLRRRASLRGLTPSYFIQEVVYAALERVRVRRRKPLQYEGPADLLEAEVAAWHRVHGRRTGRFTP